MIRRTAIVTGSTSGIGQEIARRLHADGFNVVITGRDRFRGEQVLKELGEHATFVTLDLTAPSAPSELAEAAIEHYGRLDVVVNNAAVDHTGDLLQVPIEEVRRVFVIARSSTPLKRGLMVANGVGVVDADYCGPTDEVRIPVVNITSRLASIGVPTMGIYGAAKGALKTLTTAAAVELAPRNIRVNAVAPGMTRTPLYDAWVSEQADPKQTERVVVAGSPLGRLADPTDVAAVVSFLASDEASYLTGVSIPVDGGYTAR